MINKYQFKPYSDAFPILFSQEKSRIAGAIGECLEIEHVGSTAVPGLGGKGIIDIAIAVNRGDIEAVSRKLESLGYLFRESGSVPERKFFKADLPDSQEKVRCYHVHLTFPDSNEWKTLLVFRDYLRMHPEALKEYARLKKEAAEQVNEDGEAYRRLKQPFVETILKKL